MLISISSLTYRAKAVGVHKCSGASGGTVFSMFLFGNGNYYCAGLGVDGVDITQFPGVHRRYYRSQVECTFAPDRIWVPLVVVLVLFIVGGILPGRLFARIPVSQVFRRYTEGKKGVEASVAIRSVCGCGFHLRIDVCGDGAVQLCER